MEGKRELHATVNHQPTSSADNSKSLGSEYGHSREDDPLMLAALLEDMQLISKDALAEDT